MLTIHKPPRLHLLPAKEASRCVVIARVRAKVWHILDWDLQSGELTGGSWFRGGFYPKRCDVSWDGQYMVYLATNYGRKRQGDVWSGLCRLPWLKAIAHIPNGGAWNGGGVFTERDTLAWNPSLEARPIVETEKVPFLQKKRKFGRGEDLTVLWPRLQRDGWSFDRKTEVLSHRPTPNHPELRARRGGTEETPLPQERDMVSEFLFSLEGRSDLITPMTEWAAWDANGDLLWCEAGWIHRAHVEDLLNGKGPFQSLDLNGLEPPLPKEKPSEPLPHLLPEDQE